LHFTSPAAAVQVQIEMGPGTWPRRTGCGRVRDVEDDHPRCRSVPFPSTFQPAPIAWRWPDAIASRPRRDAPLLSGDDEGELAVWDVGEAAGRVP